MQFKTNGTGFLIHGITGDFKGKVSAWFDADGKVEDAEQIIFTAVRPIKKGGPIWKRLETIGRVWKSKNKINFVVVNENILGFVDPRKPNTLQILRASVVRGAVSDGYNYPICETTPQRPATREDFNLFNVSLEGYKNDARYNFPCI